MILGRLSDSSLYWIVKHALMILGCSSSETEKCHTISSRISDSTVTADSRHSLGAMQTNTDGRTRQRIECSQRRWPSETSTRRSTCTHLQHSPEFIDRQYIHEVYHTNLTKLWISLHLTGWLGSRVVSVLDSGAKGPGFKSQSRRCRVTVLGKLFTPIVLLFTKQKNW